MTNMEQNQERNRRKSVMGKVLSNKMEKTISVQIERLEKHPRYKKYVRRYTKLFAHDEKREARPGDTVELMSTRPLSKLKRWRLVRIVTKAKQHDAERFAPEKVIESLTGGKKP